MDFDDDDCFEIEAPRSVAGHEHLQDGNIVRRKKRRKKRRYNTPGELQVKNTPHRENSPRRDYDRLRLARVRKAVIFGILILLLAWPLHTLVFSTLERHQQTKRKLAASEQEFKYDPEQAVQLARNLVTGNQSDLPSYCTPSSSSADQLEKLAQVTLQADFSIPDQSPKLRLDHHPNYYAVETNQPQLLPYIYVVESDGEHKIDLGATIGYNTITIDQLNTHSIRQASNVRLTLRPAQAQKGDLYGRVEAELPQQAGRLNLHYKQEGALANSLQYMLNKNDEVQITCNLSLYDLIEPPRYFISSLKANHWLY